MDYITLNTLNTLNSTQQSINRVAEKIKKNAKLIRFKNEEYGIIKYDVFNDNLLCSIGIKKSMIQV